MFNLVKIALNAFRESVREPVYFLMLLAALVVVGHFPAMAIFAFSEQLKLVIDSAMATTLVFGLVAAVLGASSSISREMRNGTVLLLLSKPVSRWSFILGKLFGVVAAAALFTVLCGFGTLAAVCFSVTQFRLHMPTYVGYLGVIAVSCLFGMAVNFWRGGSFSEAAVAAITVLMPLFAVGCIMFRRPGELQLVDLCYALLLVDFAVIAMAALSAMLATRVEVVPNLCIMTALFFLGLTSSYLFQRETGFFWLDLLFGALYAIIPNWQFFWLADALAVRRAIPLSYVFNVALYLVLYIAFAAMWAVALFRGQEVASNLRN